MDLMTRIMLLKAATGLYEMSGQIMVTTANQPAIDALNTAADELLLLVCDEEGSTAPPPPQEPTPPPVPNPAPQPPQQPTSARSRLGKRA